MTQRIHILASDDYNVADGGPYNYTNGIIKSINTWVVPW